MCGIPLNFCRAIRAYFWVFVIILARINLYLKCGTGSGNQGMGRCVFIPGLKASPVKAESPPGVAR